MRRNLLIWLVIASSTAQSQGRVTELALPNPNSAPTTVALAPDGTGVKIGSPINIAVGPDRNIWYTKGTLLGRVTPDGVITEFTIPTPDAGATGLTAGSDRRPPDRLTNRLRFAESGANKIGFLSFP